MSLYNKDLDVSNKSFITHKPLTTYDEFYQIYKKAYLSKIYTLSHLVEQLKKLEEVEQEWVHHRDYGSYKASVGALREIIKDINNNNLFKGDENNGTIIR